MNTRDKIADLVIRLAIGVPIIVVLVPIALPFVLVQEFTERMFEPFLWWVLDRQTAARRWVWIKYKHIPKCTRTPGHAGPCNGHECDDHQ